ncbi:MFS transporter [Zhouia sp. PK063]|uniref:MFS transporter n=1 Tax=Zhouia sp. PK063 TaxID=3373602 RepID=UPI003792CE5A
MSEYQKSFKPWVPRWLMLTAIILTLIPIGSVLGIYIGGVPSAMSYYSADGNDIRFSVVVFYLAIVCTFPLEKKFFNRFASKPYFVANCIIFVVINLILYNSKSLAILIIFRFIGGALTLTFIGALFTLVFQQFHSQRTRVLGYAILYGILIGSTPLSYIIDAFVFSNYDFNAIFILKIFFCLPGFILLFFCLKNNVDFRNSKEPLRNIEWQSYILYSATLITAAYALLYGQYYGWFHSVHFTFSVILFVIFLMAFILRQLKLENPYINLSIYKYRNFRIGMLMLVAFYLAKGDTSVSYGFLANSIGLDVYFKSYVMLINGLGILVGMGLTARFILAKTKIRLIWLTGFGALLFYHIYMLFILGNQAETNDVLIPLFFQGFGNGTLMLSIVIFYVTSVPQEISFAASVTGVSYRFFTFTSSMALVAFLGLHQGSIHYHNYAQEIVVTNPKNIQHLNSFKNTLLQNGASNLQATVGANKMLGTEIKKQINLLYARDYYLYMSFFIIFVMLSIALIPHFHYKLRKIGDKLIPI